MITLKQVLKGMYEKDAAGKAVPFRVEFMTCNRQQKKGGEIREVEAVLMSGTVEDRANHKANFTRNIRIYNGGIETAVIMKIHPLLILSFNGEEMVL